MVVLVAVAVLVVMVVAMVGVSVGRSQVPRTPALPPPPLTPSTQKNRARVMVVVAAAAVDRALRAGLRRWISPQVRSHTLSMPTAAAGNSHAHTIHGC